MIARYASAMRARGSRGGSWSRTACGSLVTTVAGHHPSTVRAQKELIEDWLNEPLEESIENSIPFLVESFREGVPQKAARAMLERRRKS